MYLLSRLILQLISSFYLGDTLETTLHLTPMIKTPKVNYVLTRIQIVSGVLIWSSTAWVRSQNRKQISQIENQQEIQNWILQQQNNIRFERKGRDDQLLCLM